MLMPLLLVVAFYASEPFPIDPSANADLRRLHEAWKAFWASDPLAYRLVKACRDGIASRQESDGG